MPIAAPEPLVVLHQPALQEQRVPLVGGLYRVGRDNQCEITVDHAAVSRQHARLERHGHHWLLRDDGSTNGLWWQGRRIRELLLRDGDSVRFGPSQEGGLPTLTFLERPQPRRLRWTHTLCLGLGGLASGGLLLLALSVLQMPIRGSLAAVRGPLVLYDGRNRPISSADALEHRELKRLGRFPPVLIQAVLSSEDSRFWWHPGVDPIGTARALVTNVLGGRVLEGGSTLTQQLARSLYPDEVGEGETLARKWRELLVALQLEARFSKSELLLSYLNRVYLGVGWGFEDASRHYFGKSASDLELEEAALLVGLLPSPNGHDPCFDPQAALEARNQVLAKMAVNGRIRPDEERRARRSAIQLAPDACRSMTRRPSPFYSDQVRRDLESVVGADVAAEGNFLVDTHLDASLQATVERLLRQRLTSNASLGIGEGAVVVLDSRNGGILAIAGGKDYRQSQFNRASMALRQPGSAFKLLPYLVALDRGAKPGDGISCDPLRWRGQTFSSGCRGSLSLRQALATSNNPAAVRLTQRVGPEAVVQMARDLGITSALDPVPGLALGQSEVTLLELTAAYAAIANDGVWLPASTIRRLTDAEACMREAGEAADGGQPPPDQASRCRREADDGKPPANPGRKVVSPATARAMQDLLRAVVRSGTGTAAYLGGGEGGKTGTTNDNRDLVFVGFVPERHWVIGVWLGNDDNSPTRGSSSLAAGLWADIVRAPRSGT